LGIVMPYENVNMLITVVVSLSYQKEQIDIDIKKEIVYIDVYREIEREIYGVLKCFMGY